MNWIHSWDPDAHRVVARIAATLISGKSAENIVRDILLEGGSSVSPIEDIMAKIAPYADTHSGTNKAYKKYHFVDVPDRDCSGVDMGRDCSDEGCILSGIPLFAMRAADTNLPMEERSLALKYLIHLVGDIHQPMHLGFKGDHGGVGVSLNLPGHHNKHNLHQVWDRFVRTGNGDSPQNSRSHAEALVRRLATKAKNSPKRAIRQRAGSFISQDGKSLTLDKLTKLTVDMANETLRELTCQFAYSSGTDTFGNPIWIKTRGYLPQDYFVSRAKLVDLQLIRAGVRLAYILEVIDKHIRLQEVRSLGISIDESEAYDIFRDLRSPTGMLREVSEALFSMAETEEEGKDNNEETLSGKP